ncbi:MAG: PEP-CTERM sorting domain-containing protein [Gammaproteobacteria bacterium]
MKKITFSLRPVVVGMLLIGSSVAGASMITLNGTDVKFTYDDSLTGLFGAPSVSGNTLFFTPTAFNAISTKGEGTVITNSNMNILVTPKDGAKMSSVALQERGDYSLKGAGSSVDVAGQLRAFDVNHSFTVFDSADITPTAPMTTVDNKYHNWTATSSLNLSSADWQKASAINFTIENVLEATTTEKASKAFVDKKFAGMQISVATGGGDGSGPPAAVPVPAAMWLFGSGLLGLVGVSRRSVSKGA